MFRVTHKICSCFKYETLCEIWYHSYNLKNLKNTHGGIFFFTTPLWVFFLPLLYGYFFEIVQWYQIVQSNTKGWSNSFIYYKKSINLLTVSEVQSLEKRTILTDL